MSNQAKIILYLLLLLSLIGILDAGFLVYKHYTGGSLPCTVFDGCDKVTTSVYSKILGVPISLFGLVYYLFVFALTVLILDKNRPNLAGWLMIPAAGAFLFSMYLLYIQIFVLNSLCAYCILSVVNSTVIFVLVGYLAISLKLKNQNEK